MNIAWLMQTGHAPQPTDGCRLRAFKWLFGKQYSATFTLDRAGLVSETLEFSGGDEAQIDYLREEIVWLAPMRQAIEAHLRICRDHALPVPYDGIIPL